MVHLLYGSGLRLLECLRLRVKDIDFGYRQIAVREGKGMRERITILPERARSRLISPGSSSSTRKTSPMVAVCLSRGEISVDPRSGEQRQRP